MRILGKRQEASEMSGSVYSAFLPYREMIRLLRTERIPAGVDQQPPRNRLFAIPNTKQINGKEWLGPSTDDTRWSPEFSVSNADAEGKDVTGLSHQFDERKNLWNYHDLSWFLQ
jgi:hypothetical protein